MKKKEQEIKKKEKQLQRKKLKSSSATTILQRRTADKQLTLNLKGHNDGPSLHVSIRRRIPSLMNIKEESEWNTLEEGEHTPLRTQMVHKYRVS